MNICIYGASSNEIDAHLLIETEKLGTLLAKEGHTLYYGGGATGAMGAAARGFEKGNGKIVGVAPRFFDVDDILFKRATELIYTDTMRERKQYLEEHSDAFLVSPGGIGTMDEFFEIFTLKSLGKIGDKPVILFNVDHCYDALLALLQGFVSRKFMPSETWELLKIAETPEEVLKLLKK